MSSAERRSIANRPAATLLPCLAAVLTLCATVGRTTRVDVVVRMANEDVKTLWDAEDATESTAMTAPLRVWPPSERFKRQRVRAGDDANALLKACRIRYLLDEIVLQIRTVALYHEETKAFARAIAVDEELADLPLADHYLEITVLPLVSIVVLELGPRENKPRACMVPVILEFTYSDIASHCDEYLGSVGLKFTSGFELVHAHKPTEKIGQFYSAPFTTWLENPNSSLRFFASRTAAPTRPTIESAPVVLLDKLTTPPRSNTVSATATPRVTRTGPALNRVRNPTESNDREPNVPTISRPRAGRAQPSMANAVAPSSGEQPGGRSDRNRMPAGPVGRSTRNPTPAPGLSSGIAPNDKRSNTPSPPGAANVRPGSDLDPNGRRIREQPANYNRAKTPSPEKPPNVRPKRQSAPETTSDLEAPPASHPNRLSAPSVGNGPSDKPSNGWANRKPASNGNNHGKANDSGNGNGNGSNGNNRQSAGWPIFGQPSDEPSININRPGVYDRLVVPTTLTPPGNDSRLGVRRDESRRRNGLPPSDAVDPPTGYRSKESSPPNMPGAWPTAPAPLFADRANAKARDAAAQWRDRPTERHRRTEDQDGSHAAQKEFENAQSARMNVNANAREEMTDHVEAGKERLKQREERKRQEAAEKERRARESAERAEQKRLAEEAEENEKLEMERAKRKRQAKESAEKERMERIERATLEKQQHRTMARKRAAAEKERMERDAAEQLEKERQAEKEKEQLNRLRKQLNLKVSRADEPDETEGSESEDPADSERPHEIAQMARHTRERERLAGEWRTDEEENRKAYETVNRSRPDRKSDGNQPSVGLKPSRWPEQTEDQPRWDWMASQPTPKEIGPPKWSGPVETSEQPVWDRRSRDRIPNVNQDWMRQPATVEDGSRWSRPDPGFPQPLDSANADQFINAGIGTGSRNPDFTRPTRTQPEEEEPSPVPSIEPKPVVPPPKKGRVALEKDRLERLAAEKERQDKLAAEKERQERRAAAEKERQAKRERHERRAAAEKERQEPQLAAAADAPKRRGRAAEAEAADRHTAAEAEVMERPMAPEAEYQRQWRRQPRHMPQPPSRHYENGDEWNF